MVLKRTGEATPKQKKLQKNTPQTLPPEREEQHFEEQKKSMEKSPHNKPTYSVIIAIVAVGLVVACFIFSYLQIKNLKQEISGLQREVSSLQRKNTSLEATINSLDNSDFSIIVAQYDGSSSTSNNVSWIGERSLGLPEVAKGKQCYVLGSRLSGADGGTVRGFLGKNSSNGIYYFAENYQADVNFFEQKIEISKFNGSANVNLSKTERNNLYFSITLLCKQI